MGGGHQRSGGREGEEPCPVEGTDTDEGDAAILIEAGRLVHPVPYAARSQMDVSKMKVKRGDYDEAAQGDEALPAIATDRVEAFDKHRRRACIAMLPRGAQSDADKAFLARYNIELSPGRGEVHATPKVLPQAA